MAARRRHPSPAAQRMKQAAGDNSRQLASDWLSLTFIQDRQKLVGPITPTIINWLFVAIVAVVIWQAGFSKAVAAVIGAWLVITLLRGSYVQRRRRKQLATMFESLAPLAKWPTGTASKQASPSSYLTRVKWGGKGRPSQFTATLNSASPAATAPLLRTTVEAAIENLPHALDKTGGEWLFTWNKSAVVAQVVPPDDPRLVRKSYARKIARLITEIFGVRLTPTTADGWSVDITAWASAETQSGETAEHPATFTVVCGGRDLTDPALRDTVERRIERAIPTPGEWLFDWRAAESALTVESADSSSLEAQRKRTERRMSDDMNSLVLDRKKDPVVVEVQDWIDPTKALPRTLHVTFGTLALDDPRRRDAIEDGFDAAVANRWDGARALFRWQHGAITELDIALVSKSHPDAQRRHALTRFRNVTNAKFGSGKNPVLTEVIEWQEGELVALPQRARVTFGTTDVTKQDTKDAFQDHWDSIDDSNDWHYEWNAAEGFVEMVAVDRIPDAVAYPAEDSDERRELNDAFRAGKVFVGWKKGGGFFVWDLNQVAHGLIGGATGAGKSVLLDTILQSILTNRDIAEAVVCDLKMTDFTWTPEFPNVITFAGTPHSACEAVADTKAEMERRKRLLNKRNVRNLRSLRKLYAEHPELEAEDGPCPKRRFLFFDEIGEFLAKSKDKDLEEVLDVARSDLESIGRLARAFEINIVAAAQKPEATIVSTQLKLQMQFRTVVGPVDEYTSKQIIESNHGTRFPPAVPKGRAWAWTSAAGFNLIQVPFLPSETEVAPWDPSITIEGSRERLRTGLENEGWTQIMEPNADGGRDPRWLRVENAVPEEPADDSHTPPPEPAMPTGLPDDAGDAYLDDPALFDDAEGGENVVYLGDRDVADSGQEPVNAGSPWGDADDSPPWDL